MRFIVCTQIHWRTCWRQCSPCVQSPTKILHLDPPTPKKWFSHLTFVHFVHQSGHCSATATPICQVTGAWYHVALQHMFALWATPSLEASMFHKSNQCHIQFVVSLFQSSGTYIHHFCFPFFFSYKVSFYLILCSFFYSSLYTSHKKIASQRAIISWDNICDKPAAV